VRHHHAIETAGQNGTHNQVEMKEGQHLNEEELEADEPYLEDDSEAADASTQGNKALQQPQLQVSTSSFLS
jgi:hypothetical protein